MDRLADQLAIRDVLAGYCHLIDDGAFDDLAELFTADASLEFEDQLVVGRSGVRDWFAATQPSERRGKHLTVNTVVEVAGEQAVARSDYVFLAFSGGELRPFATGTYVDDLVRIDGDWLIERRRIDLLRPR